ncbi:hypothetical protein F4556_007380 [Kitasatospora gansuensis]|uniref:Uncharacterized protein n=1 Tax=Kitasatospora gansuensis TaxID=258050 RepID=A0A7W7WE85_9ACTN|nr:hypothetical protein [Kitasatospora gansuensis]MBB4951845.1 hypothetical protein [Kitasatospora gansuensis]
MDHRDVLHQVSAFFVSRAPVRRARTLWSEPGAGSRHRARKGFLRLFLRAVVGGGGAARTARMINLPGALRPGAATRGGARSRGPGCADRRSVRRHRGRPEGAAQAGLVGARSGRGRRCSRSLRLRLRRCRGCVVRSDVRGVCRPRRWAGM